MSTTPILDQAPSDRAALHQLDMAVQFGHLPTPRGLRFGDDHSVTVDCHTRIDHQAWSAYFAAADSRETQMAAGMVWLHAYTFDWHGRYVSVDAMLDVPAAVSQLPCTLPPCTLPRADGRLFCTEHAALADKGIGAPVIPCRKCETGSGCHMYTAGCDLYRAEKMEPVEVPELLAEVDRLLPDAAAVVYDEQTRDAHPRADLRSYDPAASFAVVVRAAEQVRAVAEALLGETAGGAS